MLTKVNFILLPEKFVLKSQKKNYFEEQSKYLEYNFTKHKNITKKGS